MNRVNALLTLLLLSIFAPCEQVSKGHAQMVGYKNEVYVLEEGRKYIVHEPLPVHQSRTAVGNFNSLMIFIADQLERNIDRKILGNTFIVSTFSNLNNLNESSALGRLMGENIIHEMQIRQWKVFDVRLTRDVVINEGGEFSLSHDIKKLREAYKVGGIITGTYSSAENSIIVNARAIDIDTGVIISTAQALIPLNNFSEALLYDAAKLKPMKIVGN